MFFAIDWLSWHHTSQSHKMIETESASDEQKHCIVPQPHQQHEAFHAADSWRCHLVQCHRLSLSLSCTLTTLPSCAAAVTQSITCDNIYWHLLTFSHSVNLDQLQHQHLYHRTSNLVHSSWRQGNRISDFHKIFIDEVKVSKPLL